jgi:anhydro-N-acetylmuramic acid kinase
MSKPMRAIGLMSGTSMDGIDVALIDTDGEESVRRGPERTFPYPEAFRLLLARAVDEAKGLTRRDSLPDYLGDIERELIGLHAGAVARFLAEHQLDPAAIDVIGFHGHTVLHKRGAVIGRMAGEPPPLPGVALWRPASRPRTLTVQIGDGQLLARTTQIDVVYDLRAADCAAGGQGAPLAPVYHRALAARLKQRPLAVLNIGGVANVTWIGRDGQLIAFDTGPGGAMIDDWALRHTGKPCDENGALAAAGRADQGLVKEYLKHSHFAALPPKSLDRNAFVPELVDHLSPADGAATLTAFTAAAVGRALEHLPEEPQLWIIGGGGRKNRTLMSMIAAHVHNAVVPAEAVGFDGDFIEAEAWAYLAVRSLKRLPITFPGTTGVAAPLTGGVLARAHP